MSCLPCTEPVFCACTPSQTCSFIRRSCNTCMTAVCTEKSSPTVQSTTASTVGGALGGVLGILVGIGLVYWFWWKPRGLAASRKRYSRHLSARQSKFMTGGGAGEKKLHLSASSPTSPNGVSKRSSVHLRMENVEESLNRRNTGVSPYLDDVGSTAATGTRTTPGSVESTGDNSFADSARFSLAASTRTSEFSFRSSHSTNIIPIAYIPPHSSSLSVDDTNRGAFGEEDGGRLSAYGGMRGSVPVSMASRDSLGNAVDVVAMNLLAPIASPDSSHNTYRVSTSGAPIRPPRSPGLDLQLPKPSPTTSPLTSPRPPGTDRSRPPSGFPWDLAPPQRPELISAFSTSSLVLPAPGEGVDRGVSVLLEPSTGKQSHLSVFSTASSDSSRSGNSTLSYILDPPQIITPVNPTGLRRVLGRETAGLVRLNGSGSLPGSPAESSNPTTPALSSPLSANDTVVNPFSDDADINATPTQPFLSADRTSTQSTSTIGSFNNDESRWTASSSNDGDGRRETGTSFAPSFVIQTASTVDLGDMPMSAQDHSTSGDSPGINGGFGKGVETSRFTTGGLIRASSLTRNGNGSSRESYASSSKGTDSMSMLDGIPFVAPSNFVNASAESLASRPYSSVSSIGDSRDENQIRSPLFPVPNCLSNPAATRTTISKPASTPGTIRATSNGSLLRSMRYDDEEGDLPAPFLPFAGQRPSSASTIGGMSFAPRGMSTDMSIRSGFGSGLDGIPFQLGFPGGMEGGSERNSVMTVDSFAGGEGSVWDSMVSTGSSAGGEEDQSNRLLVGNGRPYAPSSNNSFVSSTDASFVTAASPSLQSKTSFNSLASKPAATVHTIEDDPFGRHAEVGVLLETARKDTRDSTSSIDTLALSAGFARDYTGED